VFSVKNEWGASVINSYQSLAFYEARIGSGVPRPLLDKNGKHVISRFTRKVYEIRRLNLYRVVLAVLDPRKCEYLKDYSLDFEHAYMTTYLAS